MRFRAIPPVRRAVPLTRQDLTTPVLMQHFFHENRLTLFPSGTAALANAISLSKIRSHVNNPEVILPAYGCPDLVAACVHAHVYPKLVDVRTDHWGYEPESLQRSLSKRTIALVAVNLLGIGDESDKLKDLCRDQKISLIQDSAQHLPRSPINWPGDFVVLSFGRGKPLNLLQGGALVTMSRAAEDHAASFSAPVRATKFLRTRAAAIAFNVLTRPHAYWIVSKLPGTGLGDVTYKKLTCSAPLSNHIWGQIESAFRLYCAKPSYLRELWAEAIDEWSKIGIAELGQPGTSKYSEPLRLPLLAPNQLTRDGIVTSLNRRHLGASRLYGATLPQIEGVPEIIQSQGPFPGATQLAMRLFTLPTHSLVTAQTVDAARTVISHWHRTQ